MGKIVTMNAAVMRLLLTAVPLTEHVNVDQASLGLIVTVHAFCPLQFMNIDYFGKCQVKRVVERK